MSAVRTLLVSTVLASPGLAAAQVTETGFLNRTVILDGTEYVYQVYVPRGYRQSTAWPVILALHGAGERGDDGLLQTQVGLASAIRRHADRYPAIVVFPQTPSEGTWQGPGARVALAALDQSIAEFNADASRVYLTGLSMGGNGTWYLGYHHADRFAALIVVCGWISELPGGRYPAIAPDSSPDPFAAVAERVSGIPIWIFHGDADEVVPVEESRRMAEALGAMGADVRFTELPGVGHNAWDPAYDLKTLPVWLFKQQRR